MPARPNKQESAVLPDLLPPSDPVVDASPLFVVGGQVRHCNGAIYTVRLIHPEGIGLDHVANLVHPSALTPI